MARTCSIRSGSVLIAEKVGRADTFFSRLIGLQGKRTMEDGEGLLISPCNQIHSFNMKFDIDVLFLSIDGTVLHTIEYFKPNKVSPKIKRCTDVLELKGGSIHRHGIEKMSVLVVVDENNL